MVGAVVVPEVGRDGDLLGRETAGDFDGVVDGRDDRGCRDGCPVVGEVEG